MDKEKKRNEAEIITYDDLRLLLGCTFDKYPFERIIKYDITPATFEGIARVYGIAFSYENLGELLCDQIDESQLYDKIFSGHLAFWGKIIVITDEYIRKKEFPIIEFADLKSFINDYSSEFGYEIFQPLDLIFWSTDQKLVIIVHHEGYYAHLRYG